MTAEKQTATGGNRGGSNDDGHFGGTRMPATVPALPQKSKHH